MRLSGRAPWWAPWRRPTAGPRAGYRGSPADRRAEDALPRRLWRGAVLTALTWLLAARLGLLDVAGLPELRWLPLVALAGAALGWRRWLLPLYAVASLGLVLLVLVTQTPAIVPAVRDHLRRDARADAVDPASVDAVVVLSAGVTDAGRITGQGPERLLTGLALARRTGRPLVVSVIWPPKRPQVTSLADQRALAALAGIGADRLLYVSDVHATRDEAVKVAALARARGWGRVALVTSPLHARRACATFERAGLPVACVPADSRELVLEGPRALAGAEQRATAFALWLYETVGWWVYRARGWV